MSHDTYNEMGAGKVNTPSRRQKAPAYSFRGVMAASA